MLDLEEIRQAIREFIENTWQNVAQDDQPSSDERESETDYRLNDWEWSNGR